MASFGFVASYCVFSVWWDFRIMKNFVWFCYIWYEFTKLNLDYLYVTNLEFITWIHFNQIFQRLYYLFSILANLQPHLALYWRRIQPPLSQLLWIRKSQNWNDSEIKSIRKVTAQHHLRRLPLQVPVRKLILAVIKRNCVDLFRNTELVSTEKNVNLPMVKRN